MEVIFRYGKITLLRFECLTRFKVTLIFSYLGLVVDASTKEAQFTCSARLELDHTFFQNIYNISCENTIPCFIQVQFNLS